MLKITSLVGARPQIIKAAALSRSIIDFFGQEIVEQVVHSGQHYDENLSENFINQLNLTKPVLNLKVGSASQGAQTAMIIQGFEQHLLSDRPDVVVLYGDTNTTVAGALVASKLGIPIAHIEAGLRSFNKGMPEEINRVICDHCSTFLFCPTETAISNLSREGLVSSVLKKATIDSPFIKNVGDIMLDNLNWIDLDSKDHQDAPFVIATIHRKENILDEQKLKNIFQAFNELPDHLKLDLKILLHPGTKKELESVSPSILKELENQKNIEVLQPQDYLTTMQMLSNASLLITDSGGLQKEAYHFEVPLVVVRDQSEWIEIMDHGFGVLCKAEKDSIIKASTKMLNKKMDDYKSFYGDGKTAVKILQTLKDFFDA